MLAHEEIPSNVQKLSRVVLRIWSGRREDWCLCCSPLSRTGPGSNQRPTTHPPQLPSLLFPSSPLPSPPLARCSHRIFSHYSEADRWASLCISPMYFLKSEKPIHLGQTREEEGSKGKKLQNSFFFHQLFARAQVSFTRFLSTLFVSPSLIVLCLIHFPSRALTTTKGGKKKKTKKHCTPALSSPCL